MKLNLVGQLLPRVAIYGSVYNISISEQYIWFMNEHYNKDIFNFQVFKEIENEHITIVRFKTVLTETRYTVSIQSIKEEGLYKILKSLYNI